MQILNGRKAKLPGILAIFCSLAVIGCASSSSYGGNDALSSSDNQTITQNDSSTRQTGTQPQQRPRKHRASKKSPKNSARIITKVPPVVENGTPQSATELWLFGIGNPALTTPIGAKGARVVIDLRHLPVSTTNKSLKAFADRGLGLALCFRWRNPSSNKHGKVKAGDDYDVAPTKQEADHAISKLKKLLSSKDAKRIGNRLFIQFYNEIGSGPGHFQAESADELFAFATRAAAEIRKVNPELRISGPGFTSTEIQADPTINSPKAEIIRKGIAWTTEYADVSDLHIHGTDGSWSRAAFEKLRGRLDQTERGKTVGLVAFKWSPADYPDRNNDAGLRNAIRGIWKTLNDFHVIVAGYSPYWPLRNKASSKMADKFGWVSIIKEDGSRNAPIFETLQEIGGGTGIDESKSKRGRSGKRSKKNRK